ncbi:hypothetical protein [Ureibacillus acetophenoni]|uniref:Uncharacterized protein n=1 Tax=Ureibacillus acetophenoni TaxID=614649 RepID=A0A285UKI6_9BACL|nr:hypothetical protein [Ureibacillus acetophenoni]SOC42283.1 hypothetical protein SAMN05877842_1128 [Ureibacillus acetophenoni]
MRLKLVDDIGITPEENRLIFDNGDMYRPIRTIECTNTVDTVVCYKINDDGTDGDCVVIKLYSDDGMWDDVEAEIFLRLVK